MGCVSLRVWQSGTTSSMFLFFFLLLECLHSAHSFCDEWCESRSRRHQQCVFMRGRRAEGQYIKNLHHLIVWDSDHRIRLIDTPILTKFYYSISWYPVNGTIDWHNKRIALQKPFHSVLKGKGMPYKVKSFKWKFAFHSRK